MNAFWLAVFAAGFLTLQGDATAANPCDPVAPIILEPPQKELADKLAPGGAIDSGIVGTESAEPETPWPAACRAKPATQITTPQKNFCLNFAADYFYRLRFSDETLTFSGKKGRQAMERPRFSTEGAAFLLAQVQNESEWGTTVYTKYHNYWGLNSSATDCMRFGSFESGLAYYFNHLSRGIGPGGEDIANHPGWPDYLKLMATESFTAKQANRSLNSGPWCTTFPAYNAGRPKTCEGTAPGKKCPCVDYAASLMIDINLDLSKCLGTYQKFPNEVVQSVIYPTDPPGLPNQLERRAIVIRELTRYARDLCKN